MQALPVECYSGQADPHSSFTSHHLTHFRSLAQRSCGIANVETSPKQHQVQIEGGTCHAEHSNNSGSSSPSSLHQSSSSMEVILTSCGEPESGDQDDFCIRDIRQGSADLRRSTQWLCLLTWENPKEKSHSNQFNQEVHKEPSPKSVLDLEVEEREVAVDTERKYEQGETSHAAFSEARDSSAGEERRWRRKGMRPQRVVRDAQPTLPAPLLPEVRPWRSLACVEESLALDGEPVGDEPKMLHHRRGDRFARTEVTDHLQQEIVPFVGQHTSVEFELQHNAHEIGDAEPRASLIQKEKGKEICGDEEDVVKVAIDTQPSPKRKVGRPPANREGRRILGEVQLREGELPGPATRLVWRNSVDPPGKAAEGARGESAKTAGIISGTSWRKTRSMATIIGSADDGGWPDGSGGKSKGKGSKWAGVKRCVFTRGRGKYKNRCKSYGGAGKDYCWRHMSKDEGEAAGRGSDEAEGEEGKEGETLGDHGEEYAGAHHGTSESGVKACVRAPRRKMEVWREWLAGDRSNGQGEPEVGPAGTPCPMQVNVQEQELQVMKKKRVLNGVAELNPGAKVSKRPYKKTRDMARIKVKKEGKRGDGGKERTVEVGKRKKVKWEKVKKGERCLFQEDGQRCERKRVEGRPVCAAHLISNNEKKRQRYEEAWGLNGEARCEKEQKYNKWRCKKTKVNGSRFCEVHAMMGEIGRMRQLGEKVLVLAPPPPPTALSNQKKGNKGREENEGRGHALVNMSAMGYGDMLVPFKKTYKKRQGFFKSEIPKEERCRRDSGQNWRCELLRVPGHTLCAHHLALSRANQQKQKLRLENSLQIVPVDQPLV